MTSRNYVSEKHLEVLVEFLSHHVDLARGRLRCRDGRAKASQLWNEAATLINAEGGQGRDGKGWNKWYTDYKSRLLNRHSIIKKNQTGTGGGTGKAVTPLSNIEERLLSLLGADDKVTGRDGEELASCRIYPDPDEMPEQSTTDASLSSEVMLDQIIEVENEAEIEFINVPEEQSVPVVEQPSRKKRKTVESQQSNTALAKDKLTNESTLSNLTEAYKDMANAVRSLSSSHDKLVEQLVPSHEKLSTAVYMIAQEFRNYNNIMRERLQRSDENEDARNESEGEN